MGLHTRIIKVNRFTKQIYNGSNIISVALFLVTIALCATIALMFQLPASDAHGVAPNEQGDNIIMQIDVNLKDNAFFAWHRDHPVITIGDIDMTTGKYTLANIPDVANGVNLNKTAVIMIICDSIAILLGAAFSIAGIKKFTTWKSSRILIAMLWVNTLLLFSLLIGALAMKSGSAISAFMQFGIDGKKLDSDAAQYMTWMQTHPETGDLCPYRFESIVVSYTKAGGIIVSLISAIAAASAAIICFGIHKRYYEQLQTDLITQK